MLQNKLKQKMGDMTWKWWHTLLSLVAVEITRRMIIFINRCNLFFCHEIVHTC